MCIYIYIHIYIYMCIYIYIYMFLYAHRFLFANIFVECSSCCWYELCLQFCLQSLHCVCVVCVQVGSLFWCMVAYLACLFAVISLFLIRLFAGGVGCSFSKLMCDSLRLCARTWVRACVCAVQCVNVSMHRRRQFCQWVNALLF